MKLGTAEPQEHLSSLCLHFTFFPFNFYFSCTSNPTHNQKWWSHAHESYLTIKVVLALSSLQLVTDSTGEYKKAVKGVILMKRNINFIFPTSFKVIIRHHLACWWIFSCESLFSHMLLPHHFLLSSLYTSPFNQIMLKFYNTYTRLSYNCSNFQKVLFQSDQQLASQQKLLVSLNLESATV